ncbi:hypothetical protein [Cyclobacterium roseum]|uniref:hypothetical protein n=1 Tax=Cyclobacterium roseum TaxID=2666137 RepID=UPI0013906FDF|nr:hypothetical protein [Cyclobacterium roseum]
MLEYTRAISPLFNRSSSGPKKAIEPSLAITHRPYHTKMPDGFRQQDDQWSKFLFGEPGLHVGFNF